MIHWIIPLLIVVPLVFSDTDDDRVREKGGSFFLVPSFMNLDMGPVQDLAKSENSLAPYTFGLDKGAFSCNGFGAYWGSKNSFRGGFGLYAGYRRYQSDPVTRPLLNDFGDTLRDGGGSVRTADSIMNLFTVPLYVGYLFDRSQSFGNVNFYGGGLIGGGALMVVKSGEALSEKTAFINQSMDMNDTAWSGEHSDHGDVAVAPMSVAELHAGATYTFARWFHVGAEAHVTAFFATQGFINGRDGSFTTFNPGVRMRIILGTLG